MTRIESPVVRVAASPAKVSQDFQDWNTFGELLAAGPVSDFKAEGDKCAFKVTGGVAVHLVRTSDNSASEGKVLTLATEAPTPVKGGATHSHRRPQAGRLLVDDATPPRRATRRRFALSRTHVGGGSPSARAGRSPGH